jgi:hypothetical protein
VAYDEHLANRIRDLLVSEPGVTEKRMFGGWVARGIGYARSLPSKP